MRKLIASLTAAALALLLTVFVVTPAFGSDDFLAPENHPAVTATSQPGAVKLTWTEPGLSGVVGYMIRRGAAPGQENRWPVNDFPVVGKTYLDRNVQPGESYYYEVIPVLSDGTWAGTSNEVEGTAGAIPAGYRLIRFDMDAMEAAVLTSGGESAVTLQARPVIHMGRVMLSLDDLKALFGADLSYDKETQTITFVQPSGRVMTAAIGEHALRFGKATKPDSCSPVMRNGVVYMPVRWVAESFEGQLVCDPVSHTITVEIMPIK